MTVFDVLQEGELSESLEIATPSSFLPNRTCTFDIRTLDFTKYNYTYRRSTWQAIGAEEMAKIGLYILVILLSLVGNILVILAVVLNSHMRTSVNWYLVNLATADLLVTISSAWIHPVRHLSHPNYVLPSYICHIEGFVNATALSASVLTLTVISVGRFIAVLFPLYSHTSPNHFYKIIATVWLISITFASPTLFFRTKYKIEWQDFELWQCDEFWPVRGYFDENLNTCVVNFNSKKIFYALFNIIFYFIPVTVMILSYLLVIWRLWASPPPGEHDEYAMNAILNSKRKVVKMVTVVLVTFIICWTPLQSIVLYSAFVHRGQIPNWFSSFEFFAYFIAHANSAINPIIYCSVNTTYRDSLRTIFQRNFFTRVSFRRAKCEIIQQQIRGDSWKRR